MAQSLVPEVGPVVPLADLPVLSERAVAGQVDGEDDNDDIGDDDEWLRVDGQGRALYRAVFFRNCNS